MILQRDCRGFWRAPWEEYWRAHPYGFWWCFRRWKRRRKIKVDYPGFWQAVVHRRAW